MPEWSFLLVAGAAVLVGAVVQGGVGLGLGLVAAPVVALLDPGLMPGSVLVVTAVLPLLTVAAEWRHMDWRGVGWALAGRVPGTAAGVWVVAALPADALGLAVGVLVLAAAALTASGIRLRPTPVTLGVAGAVSGVTGTATSVGGPPIALVYQRERGPTVRATLGGYFAVGVAASLAALAAGGQLDARQAAAGAALVPFAVAGFLLARPVRRVLDGAVLRRTLLALVAVSGALLVARSALHWI
ncbi:sulfite exporter TauE/SafE family protein [Marinitenerispora sediminis]|uniref:Probable membrane transporter protein n=1 Tax=Marinitenerispora sediminis TaxID=1931232 RepID=A0A368T935_9ACTN|nr:sulfite exporter TauE/SafE family protein [Marinitenerispora sediminis]RCV52363.1 sulfite transporter TauE/SafE [Marinitenerispora sediminis]RCV60928.1 sulfite transporter TauE/SafE [Marinitenerispora sediminis]RCV62219.1 sulfite transporter TauE/SafE [Marinitenerispora sediminis]